MLMRLDDLRTAQGIITPSVIVSHIISFLIRLSKDLLLIFVNPSRNYTRRLRCLALGLISSLALISFWPRFFPLDIGLLFLSA